VDARTQAVLSRFVLGLLLTEIPIVSAMLLNPNADWRFALAGVLGGLAAALDKYMAPQLVALGDVPVSPGSRPVVVGVSLKDIHPAPIKIGSIRQGPHDAA
jgi:hypothetical protein